MANPRRLTVEDVMDLDYPGTPAWSGTGRLLAALVYEDDGNALLIFEEGDSWRVSPGDGHVTGFAWAPDCRANDLVLRTDDGESYYVDADDRSVCLIARSPEGESNHVWSNDGESVAYYCDGSVRLRDTDTFAERGFDLPERGPFFDSERMFAWDDNDTRLAYAFADGGARHVGVIDTETGELAWRTAGNGSHANPTWLADGRLVFERIEDQRTRRAIVAVDLATSEREDLFVETDRERGVVSSGSPRVSPDGQRLSIACSIDGWEHVHVIDTRTGKRHQLTEGQFEDKGLAGSTPRWLDETTLVFATNRRDPGERAIYAVDVDSGEVTPLVTTPGSNVSPRPSPSGDRIAYLHADRSHSVEVRVRPIADTGNATRLTESGVDDWPVEPIEPQRVTIDGADGLDIDAYLLDPRETETVPDDASDLPAVVWVHGGPMRQMRDGWHPSRSYGLPYGFHQYLATRGYVGCFVNYRGGIGYGKEFRQALADGYGRVEMQDVVTASDHLKGLDFVAADSVAVWGLSYGGYAALQLLGTHPDAFALGVNLAGLADIECHEEWAAETKFPATESSQSVLLGGHPWEATEEWEAASPRTHMDRYEAPIYSFHGTADRYVSVEQLDIVVETLLELGKEYEADYYPGETHVFSKRATWRRTFGKIEDALAKHLSMTHSED